MATKTHNRITQLTQDNGQERTPAIAELVVAAPNMRTASMLIRGTAPLVIHKFSAKARDAMVTSQAAGSKGKNANRTREPKNFDTLWHGALYRDVRAGWCGFPAGAFRSAMISACRVAGVVMTRAKLAIFVEADGYDELGMGLVRITKGEPQKFLAPCRNDDGSMDIRARGKFDPGWEAMLRIRFDADQLSLDSVGALLMRAGLQVGIGDGRPDSRRCAGVGWGLFEIVKQA